MGRHPHARASVTGGFDKENPAANDELRKLIVEQVLNI